MMSKNEIEIRMTRHRMRGDWFGDGVLAARPVETPTTAPIPSRLERMADTPATIPDAPCDACHWQRKCAVRRETCLAYRQYVQQNYPDPVKLEQFKRKNMRKLRTGTD